MPEYSFRNSAGETKWITFSMRDVPSIGESVERDGETWTRVYHSNYEQRAQMVKDKFPIVATSLPMGLDGFKSDKRGFTVIENRSQLSKLERMHGFKHVPD